MCDCIDVDFGTFDNCVLLDIPKELDIRYNNPEKKKRVNVSVDRCIAEEVKHLWSLGILTTGCCCGHNKVEFGGGYIGVEKEYIPKMKDLGYEVWYNKCRPNDEDSFKVKSV